MVERSVLWPLKRHTTAKHQILRWYLDAWFPILGAGRLPHAHVVLIDGFAGPGRYRGGEKGSPLIMLDAYLEQRASIRATPHFYFIESDPSRAEHLRQEVANYNLAGPADARVITGAFEDEFPRVLEDVRERFGAGTPTFAFVDPFGAGQIRDALSAPLLGQPRCELLVYVPVNHLARFVDDPAIAPTLNALYPDGRWRSAQQAASLAERRKILHDLFLEQMRTRADLARSFEIRPDKGGNSYFLFFGTNNPLGLERMKDAMWRVDPAAGSRFRDSTSVDHPVLFQPLPDFAELERLLRERFGANRFSITQAEDFTLRETAFRHNGHLKKPVLRAAEKRGDLEVERPEGKKAGSFVAGTRMRFVS